MLRLLVSLVIFLSIAVDVFAQASLVARRNDNAATVQILTNGQLGALATDDRGRLFTIVSDPVSGEQQSVIPVSHAEGLNGSATRIVGGLRLATDAVEAGSTTTVINATGHVAKEGDHIRFDSASANPLAWSPVKSITPNTITLTYPLPAVPVVGNTFIVDRMTPITASGASSGSALAVNVDYNLQASAAAGILKAEDAPHTTSDAGVAALSVRNTSYAAFAADQDYAPIATGGQGNVLNTLTVDTSLATNITPIRQEDSAHTSADAGIFTLGVANEALANFSVSDGDYVPIGTTIKGAVLANIDLNTQIAASRGILKQEDAPAASQDALVGIAAVRNNAGTATAGTDGDYIALTTSSNGGLWVSGATLEDNPAVNQDAIVITGAMTEDPLVKQTGATGDYGTMKLDLMGRTITTMAPAGETWSSCLAADVNAATQTQLKAAVASNRIYVTEWSCYASGTTANVLLLTDGSGGTTLDYMQVISNAVHPGSQKTYSIPKRLTSNTALFITSTTAGTFRCCATGYTSVN